MIALELETTISNQHIEIHNGQLPMRATKAKLIILYEADEDASQKEAVIQLPPRRPGSLRGTVLSMAEDFNAPLDDFREYME